MPKLNMMKHTSRTFLLAVALLFIGACGSSTGGGGGGGGGAGGLGGNLHLLGSGAGVSHSGKYTVYGGLTSQAQGTSKGSIYQVTGPDATLGTERVGK